MQGFQTVQAEGKRHPLSTAPLLILSARPITPPGKCHHHHTWVSKLSNTVSCTQHPYKDPPQRALAVGSVSY